MLKRRDKILGKARSIAEKCRDEGREFAPAEADDVNAALAEAKRINVTLSADAKAQHIMGELNAMASSSAGLLPGDGRRLAFGAKMASDAANRILPPGGQKALSPSGIAVVS